MKYWMYAIRPDKTIVDHKGDSGTMSMALYSDDDGNIQTENDARPRVGVVMRVGSLYARTMQNQDWWQTTLITKIVKEWVDTEGASNVVFETKNSTYHWKTYV